MAYVTPKTNWAADNIPVASDFNRIEGNTLANHDAIVAEVAARVSAVDAEEAARIAGDAALTAGLASEITARQNADVLKMPLPSTASEWTVTDYPIGTVLFCSRNAGPLAANASSPVYVSFGSLYAGTFEGASYLAGTWRCRGYVSALVIMQRIT